MSEPRLVDPCEVVMTGENSFIRLSDDRGKTIADRVSHWRVLWSPAGQGPDFKNPKTRNFQTGSVSMIGEITERMLHYPLFIQVLVTIVMPGLHTRYATRL